MESTPTTAKKKVAADRHPVAVAFGEYLKTLRKNSDKSQAELLLRPHEVSSGGIFDAGILKVAHHPLG